MMWPDLETKNPVPEAAAIILLLSGDGFGFVVSGFLAIFILFNSSSINFLALSKLSCFDVKIPFPHFLPGNLLSPKG